MAPKTLEPGSKFEHFDRNGDGIVTDDEIAMEEKMLRIENEDAKEDQIRKMAWFALWGMLIYPATILVTSMLGYEKAAQLISDIAPTYFVAIAGLVAAFFGAQAYGKKASNGK